MAYLTIARFHGDPDCLLAEYRRSTQVMDEVGHDHGLILHAVAKTDDGLLVVNLWPSKDRSEAATADPRRLAELERVRGGIEQLEREHHEIDRCLITPRVALPLGPAA
jgi:hypothetical protein